MPNLVSTAIDGEIAVIQIDNPPVNALSNQVIAALSAAIDETANSPSVRAVVLTCAGRTFIAGADIKGLERFAWGDDEAEPVMREMLRSIENCAKPVVMAIHGTALGGGLEVAMAGHYRVAVSDAQLGQPEVNIGVIPGAEGTQRLPRLVGLEKAIEMCVSGKPVKALEALQLGLVDAIVQGDLKAGAVAFARDAAARASAPPKTCDRSDRLPPAGAIEPLLEAGREMARKTRRHMDAPLAVVDAIGAAATLPFDEGCRVEREIFIRCARSEQCKALIHAFFAERAVSRVPGIAKDTRVSPIASVGVIGAGTMGGGISMACANARIPVALSDVNQAALDKGLSTVARNYEISVKRGRLTPKDVAERMALIRPQTGLDGLAPVDLVIEAAFENLALKKQIAASMGESTSPTCILATNTSTLSIDTLATASGRPEQFVGLHFFSPANVMRLVEIVRGAATSSETLATAMAFAKRLGKVGVVVGNCEGFVGNRMMFPYMYEAQFLVEEGATPEHVDRALTDWGMAMGIFAVDDMAGLDIAWRVRQELGHFRDPGVRKPLIADRLVEMGRLGQKSGAGWYRYEQDRKPIADPDVLTLIERMARNAGIARREWTSEQIIERTIYALINEGARLLGEGFALRASDIDVIYLTGYGFPAFRGGPMFYADRVGLSRVRARIARFHQELGDRWTPAPLLEQLAKAGSTFKALDASRDVQP